MHKDFWGWSLESVNKGTVDTRYVIEYVNDKVTWQKCLKTDDNWDLYSKKEFDNIAAALEFYMTWFVSEKCFDIKMWEEIYVNGEMILEQYIEPKSTAKFYMRQNINKEMQDRFTKAERKVEELNESNKMYQEFIKKMNAENMFSQYVKERG